MAAPGETWQKNRNWSDRLHFLLETGRHADCDVVIGVNKERYKCHKLLLAIASPFFERAFYGGLDNEANISNASECSNSSNNEQAVIELPNVPSAAFTCVLHYIYWQELDAATFPFDIVGKLLQLAHILKMDDFRLKVINYLNSVDWPLGNVLSIYRAARFFNEPIILAAAYKHLEMKANQLITHSSILNQSFTTFKNIIRLLKPHCTELTIYHVIEKYCEVNNFFDCEEPPPNNSIVTSTEEVTEANILNRGAIVEKPVEIKLNNINTSLLTLSMNDSEANDETSGDQEDCQKRSIFGLVEENRAEKIAELCGLIDFEKMTPFEFALGPAKSKLLKPEQSFEILLNISKRHHVCDAKFMFQTEMPLN